VSGAALQKVTREFVLDWPHEAQERIQKNARTSAPPPLASRYTMSLTREDEKPVEKISNNEDQGRIHAFLRHCKDKVCESLQEKDLLRV